MVAVHPGGDMVAVGGAVSPPSPALCLGCLAVGLSWVNRREVGLGPWEPAWGTSCCPSDSLRGDPQSPGAVQSTKYGAFGTLPGHPELSLEHG